MDLRRLAALAVFVPAVAVAAPQTSAPTASAPTVAAAPTPANPPVAAAPNPAKPPVAAASTAAPTPTPAKPPVAAAPTAKPPVAPSAPAKPGTKTAVTLDWRSRLALAVRDLQAADPALFDRLNAIQPDREVEGELYFTQQDLHDRRAATVLLRRLLAGTDPAKVRRAIADALPLTGGDWQAGAAAMVGLDASPLVRKKLIEVMRYADAKHSLHGLRLGFKDEDLDVQAAAARAAGFHPQGGELFPELHSAYLTGDWDLRAAAVQALGMLRLPRSRDILIAALGDEEREVRLQALVALEQLDPEGLLELPQLERLAKDRKSHRIARMAQLLLQKRRAARKARKQAGTVTAATSPPAPAAPPAAP